jgi:protein-tyrosine phosphatase
MSNKTNPRDKIRVMFVCLGNICRSPVAEGVFQDLVRKAGLEDYFEIRSSGTGSWHVGEMADRRMRQTARGRGVDLDRHRGSQFETADLESYDHIFVMDRENLHDVLFLDRNERFGHKVRLFRELDPEPDHFQVPDPYYGGPEGFENVYDIVERSARALLDRLIEEHDLPANRDAAA